MRSVPVVVGLDADPVRQRVWERYAASHRVNVHMFSSVAAAQEALRQHAGATLVVRCESFERADVLELAGLARGRDEPCPVVLLTDDGDGYRRALAARGLVAEVLACDADVHAVLSRLESVPHRVRGRFGR